MSHEPTTEEIIAACRAWDGTSFGMYHSLTAANRIRDRRIRKEALEEAAGWFEKNNVLGWYATAVSAHIRALKDKEPTR